MFVVGKHFGIHHNAAIIINNSNIHWAPFETKFTERLHKVSKRNGRFFCLVFKRLTNRHLNKLIQIPDIMISNYRCNLYRNTLFQVLNASVILLCLWYHSASSTAGISGECLSCSHIYMIFRYESLAFSSHCHLELPTRRADWCSSSALIIMQIFDYQLRKITASSFQKM